MAKKLVIRAAHINDSRTIMKLMKEFAAYSDMTEHLDADVSVIEKEIFDNGAARVLLAEVDGHPVGYALFYSTFASFAGKRGLFLEDLYVTPLFRGNGYGKEIINVIKEIAETEGFHRIEWRCLKWNNRAQEFYRSLGAKEVEQSLTFRLYIGDREYMSV